MPSPKISKSQVGKKISKYNALWPSFANDLEIEMACIRAGGAWEKDGKKQGNGLAFHYNEMRKILWPRLDDHRWSQLCLKEAVASKVLTLLGAGSTGKTNFAAWYGLCYYYCSPRDTLVMVSTTDLRGLDLRIFGEIKMLHDEAKTSHDVPGHLLETKRAISTDDIEEDQIRDLRAGVIGVPTVQNGRPIGLAKWIGCKQKRILLIADECFPAGTLVDTPFGPVSIENIEAGQQVINASGTGTVVGVSYRKARSLVRIRTTDGREMVCTPNHKLLTDNGWIKALDISPGSYMMSANETNQDLQYLRNSLLPEIKRQGLRFLQGETQDGHLQTMRQSIHKSTSTCGFELLREIMCGKMANVSARIQKSVVHKGAFGETPKSKNSMASESSDRICCDYKKDEESNSRTECSADKKSVRRSEENRMETTHPRRQWNWSDQGGICIAKPFTWIQKQLRCNHQHESWEWIPTALQSRCCDSKYTSSDRSRRKFPSVNYPPTAGSSKDQLPCGSWVESVEILKQGDLQQYTGSDGDIEVYNLHVEKDHSYSVNGFIVSNCQFMGGSFLSAFANLDKNEDFRAICIGNPQDILDPLGKAAEPKDGWGSHMEPDKTAVWDTRFMNGRCVNLIGTDSPNFDYPADQPTKFPYLISREKIANTLSFFPQDSTEYYSQCIGSMKIGQMIKRVLTRDLCRQFLATSQDVVWDGPTTKICGLDAAYGGDRCVAGHVEFGKNVEGKTIILIRPPFIVPIRVNSEKQPEDQIAEWVKEYCRKNSIPPENFFHDSTGRGSLGTALARLWSAQCNPIEFGGSPTTRPVSLDLYIWDQSEKRRRLKRCDEHYSKFVTELWFSVRYAVEAGQVRGLPEDVMDEFCMREWKKVRSDKIELEKKEDMKERVGRSPDLADFCSICIEGARQRGFQISRLANSEAERKSMDWLRDLADKATTHKTHELIYS